MRGQVSRWGPNPERNFYLLHQELLWAPIDPLPKLVLIDLFHHERQDTPVAPIDERARNFNVDRKSLMRAESSLEADGYLLVRRSSGKRNLYVAAYPAVPAGHADRASFEAHLAAAIAAEDGAAESKAVPKRDRKQSQKRTALRVSGGGDQSQKGTATSPKKGLPHAREPLGGSNTYPSGNTAAATDAPPVVETPPPAEVSTPTRKVPDTPHHQLLAAYRERLGYDFPNAKQEAAAAKALLGAGHSQDDILACYDANKARDFYAEQHLSLSVVLKNIGAWKTRKPPVPVNGRHPPGSNGAAPIFDRGRRVEDFDEQFERHMRELGDYQRRKGGTL